ncbi:hypothetical protein FSPOR_5213 [Fusarium sporotrichioides]|uniref:Zn(2)-C6 fungal-type domain-containing protein n=1 Tax=Fusarium sporotrichioides TaxID=5514 RepID=A0A395S8K8_FUSSP|nr:hypothetical protein FSPOR_5213 [Fusarium sporotrichioides]
MTTDWRERSEVSDSDLTQGSGNPNPSQTKNRVSCQRCFKRKSKCDRIRPACTSCATLGVECIARSQQFDFDAKETGLTPARVNGYVESLRRRVAELEQKVETAEISRIQARQSFTSDSAPPINGKRRRSTEGHVPDDQSTVEDTMSAIHMLSNKAMAESRVNTGNGPHKLSIIESISAALAVDGRDPSKASVASSHHVSLTDDQFIQLTQDLTLSHIQRFIDWSVWLPYIDENRLMQQYNAVVGSHDGIDQPSLYRFNTYLAIAIGISMSPDTSHLTTLATNLHSAAIKLLPSILYSQEPFDTLHFSPPSSTVTNSLLAVGDFPDIKTDAISSCKSLIERLYSKSTNHMATVSFLDAYDALAAAVMYVCLVQLALHPSQQGFAQTFEVVSKASVLLTQCSTRFIAISVFQQFLLSLSTKIMEGPASVQEYLELIPPEIPSHLRALVQNYASLSPRTG